MRPILWLALLSALLTFGSAGTGSAYPASGLTGIGQQSESLIIEVDKNKSRGSENRDKRGGSLKRRGIGARMFGPYWGHGPRWGNKCDRCASKCEDDPRSADCQRCRAGCGR